MKGTPSKLNFFMFFTLILGDNFFYFQSKQTVLAMKVVVKNERQLQTIQTSKMLQLTLRIDALFEHFKQSANKLSQICQSKSGIALLFLTKAMDGLFKYIG